MQPGPVVLGDETQRVFLCPDCLMSPMAAEISSSTWERYQDLQRYINWTPADAARVRAVAPLVQRHFAALVDDFYAEIQRHPDVARVITGGAAQVARLKTTLCRWLEELFAGPYDRAYVERRWRVGYRHVEIGLLPVYTSAALSRLRVGLLDALEAEWTGELRELFAARKSINILLDLDLTIIEDAYQTESLRRQAAAERLATIGKVAGGVAHELRNPLNVVKTSVYYLRHAQQPSPEKVQAHLARIERQVEIADGVITALNDFARLPLPQQSPIEVEACLREILDAAPLPESIRVEWSLEPGGLAVLGDAAQLRIVLGNLIRNARDAMPAGGTLTLAACRQAGEVAITVRDTGVGIPAEQLSRIWEPLFSTKAKGIGLGLSIAHDIVRRHHGSLHVESQPGAGTSFTVRLPEAAEEGVGS